jgi:hypothetical protein
MKTTNLQKPASPAMQQYVEQLARFKPTKPLHKLPGHVKRERVSAGARRKQAAAAAKAAHMAEVAPKFARERTRKEIEQRQAQEGGSFTYVGRDPRRVWTAGISTNQKVTPACKSSNSSSTPAA